MKQFLLSLALTIACATVANANIYQESPYHETGIVAVRNGAVELLSYSAFPQTAANGNTYYRWHSGPGYPNFVGLSALTPLEQGYRFADGKMFIYDFIAEKETLALDFTLQPGASFSTPDGTEWIVENREQRTFTTLCGKDNSVDYQAGHTVLTVKSADGSKTDEWIENLGAVRYPLMIQAADGIDKAHVAYMNYNEEAPYLVLDFSDGQIYGRYVGNVQQLAETGSISQVFSESRVGMNGNVVEAEIEIYSYMTRVYCYAYRNGGNFEIFYRELGPFRDSTIGHSLVSLTFPNVPTGSYRYMVNGMETATGITSTSQSKSTAFLFDLSGRKLNREPQQGIYIEGGKKIISAR